MCLCVFITMWVDCALPNFHHFNDIVLHLHLDPQHCFTSTSCLSSSLLPASFIIFYVSSTPDEDHVLKALVFLIVLYVSLYR